MKSESVETKVKFKPKKKIGKIIGFCVVVLAIAGGVYYFTNVKSSDGSTSYTERTATVDTEDLSTTITGSGSMLSSTLMNVSAKTSGTIQKLYYKQGDKVKKGALICQLDATDATANVQNAQNNLAQTLLTQQQNKQDLKKLTVTSPINGQITNIAVSEGDIVQKNAPVYTITDNKNMTLTVPFNGSDIKKIAIGNVGNINLQNIMQTIKGKVIYISNAPYSTDQGGDLYNVEFAINNPGSLTEGTKASAEIVKNKATISSADVGQLAFANKVIVRSDTGGTVQKINVKMYQAVKRGQVVMKLVNQDVNDAITTTQLKIEGLQQQLANSKKQLAYCKIIAPISGEVTALSNKEGETLKMGDVLTSITDVSHMQFTIPVDELDIAKIKIGQKVNVTVDAISATSTLPLIGKVKDIAVEGSATNGVTTYDVTIAITGVTDPSTLFSRFRRSGNGGSGGGFGGSGGFGNRSSQGGSGNSGYGSNRGSSGSGSGNSGYGGFRSNSGSSGSGNSSYGNGSGFSGRSGFGQGSGGFSRMGSAFNTKDILSSLKDGMNANAEIVIEDYKNSTAVPLEAVVRYKGQSYVLVKSDAATVASLKKSGKYVDIFSGGATMSGGSRNSGGSGYSGNSGYGRSSSSNRNGNSSGYGNRSYGGNSSSGSGSSSMSSIRNSLEQYKDYYKDAIPTPVEVGVNTSASIQILSGVKVGDVVMLPPLITASKSSNNNGSTGMSGMSGLGGFGGGFGGGSGQFNRNGGGNSRYGSGRSGGGN